MSDFTEYYNQKIEERFYHTVFNGLNIIVIPKKDFRSSYAIYATNYGSVNNSFSFRGVRHDVPDGIAHFLEHKMFEKEYGDAFSKYSRTGASANAFTSFDKTAYLFSCTDHFYESLDILAEVVNTPYFTKDSVDKEQGIIGQEIQMGLDNPGSRCFYNLLGCLYEKHPVRRDIAGSVESISQITPELLYTCYDAFYNPANMVLCVCGNIEKERVIEIVEKRMRKTTPEPVQNLFPEEKDGIFSKEKEIQGSVASPIFTFGIKNRFQGKGKDLVSHQLLLDILLDAICGRSTAFHTDLYNSGLINSRFGTSSMLFSGIGAMLFEGESDRPKEVFDRISDRIEEVRRTGISSEEFERLKNKAYGLTLNSFDSTEDLASEYAELYFDGVFFLDIPDLYKELTADKANEALSYFDIDKMASSIVLPF